MGEELQEQEGEEEKEGEISPFISSLSQTLSLWPEDEEHKCPSWREGPCRYLKCLLEREKESREYDAAGYCDDCEENKNDCECDQDQELQSKLWREAVLNGAVSFRVWTKSRLLLCC